MNTPSPKDPEPDLPDPPAQPPIDNPEPPISDPPHKGSPPPMTARADAALRALVRARRIGMIH